MAHKLFFLTLCVIFISGVSLVALSAFSLYQQNAPLTSTEGGASSLSLPFLAKDGAAPSATIGSGQGTIPGIPTSTATPTPSATATPSPTGTLSFSATATATATDGQVTLTLTPSLTPSATPSATSTEIGTATETATGIPTLSATPTSTSTSSPAETPTGTATATETSTGTATFTATPTSTATETATATATITETLPPPTDAAQEGFEGEAATWQVNADKANGGDISRSNSQVLAGSFSASVTTAGSGSVAQIRATISELAANHIWGERPGTWLWQRAYLYIPATTLQQLGEDQYIDLAGFGSQSNGRGWWLRLTADGALSVYGYDSGGTPGQFSIYGQMPTDRWVEVEIGLHSQAGPGVQRAFALLIDGAFYGWYHQGQLPDTNYDWVAMGILATNASTMLELFIDQWYATTTDRYPSGSDHRSTANLQEQDYRTQSGVQWQIDWSTWRENLLLDEQFGLYSATNRLQSGRNLDRMPDLSNGWAEIEIGWPQGTPPASPNSYFGPMVGFRKEINREENLEVIPIGNGDGTVNLVLEAWIGAPVILAQWPLPVASIGGGSHIPEAGDIIRVRWQQLTESNIQVWASYYDASTETWHIEIIDHLLNGSQIGESQFGQVNYSDGYHTASSITIDSPYYSIRRFKVGTLDTYP